MAYNVESLKKIDFWRPYFEDDPNSQGGLYVAEFTNDRGLQIRTCMKGVPDGNWFSYDWNSFNKSFRPHKNEDEVKMLKLKLWIQSSVRFEVFEDFKNLLVELEI